MLSVRLLGQFQAEKNGTTIEISSRPAQLLLAYLILNAGIAQRREKLAGLFWPDSSEANARNNLRQALWRVRQAVQMEDPTEHEHIVADEATITFEAGSDYWLDVAVLRGDGEQDGSVDDLLKAVPLYQGELLPGFYDEWIVLERESAQAVFERKMQTLLDRLVAARRWPDVLEWGERWIALGQTPEPAYRALMQAHHHLGDRASVVTVYQRCVKALQEDLAVDPSAQTQALYDRLVRGEVPEAPDQIIADRYAILDLETDLLGQGGMGRVFRGRDIQTGQPVVIKALRPNLAMDSSEFVTRFIREGEALRQLNHPNIVKMVTAVAEDDRHYLVMEYVEGGSLRDLLDQGTVLPLDRVLEIGLDLADALTRTHRLDIIHRDLKPANVLLAQDGTPRLTDFGVAHLGQAERVTESGVIMGTIDYLSPEALSGETIDARCDIWSFGVLLFEMLAGRRPFVADTIAAVMAAIISQAPPELTTLRPDVPPALVDLLNQMLQKNPRQRVASVRLVGAALEALLSSAGVEEQIRLREPKPSPSPVELAPSVAASENPFRHNLPAQTTPFIGRETELAELDRLLAEPTIRLVTILGPGGMGKTRLALEAAAVQLEHFSHGVYFVSLAPLELPDPMVSTIAEALNFSFYEGSTPQQQLLDYLREKSMLLVLDNFEHLLAPLQSPIGGTKRGAELVSEILRAAAAVKILTTSRERLKLSGETIFTLEGLDVPEAEPTTGYSAIQLFSQTARQLQPNFDLTAADLHSIRHICQLVQGMPLGIILAATWLELLSPAEIAAEIKKSLDFLETELRDLPFRQRSMRAVFDHSWRLLSGAEQNIFQQLTIFRGGFSREAAEAVAEASPRVLMALVNKSLLQRKSGGRFEVHELLRQYGAKKLAEELERETTVRDRFSAFFCSRLAHLERDLKGAGQLAALTEIEADLENMRRAWIWAIDQGNLEAIEQALESLYEFYHIRSRFQEGRVDFGQAVERLHEASPQSKLVRAKLLARLGVFCFELSDYAPAHGHLQASLATAEDRREIAFVLVNLGLITKNWQGDRALAEKQLLQSLTISREVDDQDGIAGALGKLAGLATSFGEYKIGSQYARESLTVSRQLGRPDVMASALSELAWPTLCLGRYDEAESYLQEILTISEKVNDRSKKSGALSLLGYSLWCKGSHRLPEAAMLLESALTIKREIGRRAGIALTLSDLALVYRDLGEHVKAQQGNLEAVTIAREIGDPDRLSYELLCLGAVTSGLGNFQASRDYLLEAMQVASQAGIPDHTLFSLFYFAESLIKESDVAELDEAVKSRQKTKAVELLALVNHHPACWQVYRDKATRLLADLEAELPPELVAAATERGKARDLDETVQEFLAESSSINEVEKQVSGETSAESPLHNLPAQTTPFLGRETELADLGRLFAEPTIRLVTILGPGGMGKSRLAVEMAARQLDRFPNGVYFVTLASLSEPDQLVPAIADAVNYPLQADDRSPKQQVLDYLRQKQMLLVLDNFEHLVAGASLVSDILQAAPEVKVLATSRQRLQLQAETVFNLLGFRAPELTASTDASQIEQWTASDAIRLFLQGAKRGRSDFELSSDDRSRLNQICNLVDGMPLGILLAAAWVEMLSPAEIVVELEGSLDLLESELQDVPVRQRSMRAVFDHSWRLLSEAEQRTFQQLSIFRGGFTRDAAQAITKASLKALLALVNKSLLHHTPNGRFEVHELLRQYGAELLDNSDLAKEGGDRHAAYYCAFLRQRETDLKGRGQREALAEIEIESENIRDAWKWAGEHHQLEAIDQAVESLYEYHFIRSRFQEGKELFSRALNALQGFVDPAKHPRFDPVFAKVEVRLGAFCAELREHEAAIRHLQSRVQTSVPSERAFALNMLGNVAVNQEKPDEAEAYFRQSLTIYQEIDDQSGLMDALAGLAEIAVKKGDMVESKRLASELLKISRQLGQPYRLAVSLYNLAASTCQLGGYAEAAEYWQESLAIYREIGDPLGAAYCVNWLGWVSWSIGGSRLGEAVDLYEQALATFQEFGHRQHTIMVIGDLALATADLGAYEQAIEFARKGLALAEEYNDSHFIIYNLYCLGAATCGFGDLRSSRNYLAEALQQVCEYQKSDNLMSVLFFIAKLLLKESHVDGLSEQKKRRKQTTALELLAQVIQHPSTWQGIRDRAEHLEGELKTKLSPEVVAAAEVQGRGQDPWKMAEAQLADLRTVDEQT